MDSLFEYASKLSGGVPADQLKLIFCLLSAYPLASAFVRIPSSNVNVRHAFSIATSAFYLLVVFHLWSGTLQLLADAAFTYAAVKYVKTPLMPWIVFAAIMGHLTFNHALRFFYTIGLDTFEITSAQMVLTMKLTTFAWNIQDGRKADSDLDKWQLATRIGKVPSPLAFLGYVFYFPGMLVGPSVEYTYYEQLVNGKLFAAAQPTSKDGKKRLVTPEGRVRAAYTRFAFGLVFLGLYAVWGSGLDYDNIMTDSFKERNILSRILFTQLLGFAQRWKYYGVWLLTEGASILTGLGFNGYDAAGKSLWNRTANVDIWNIEFAPNFKVLLDSWNMNTNIWLRNCVYRRVTPKGKKPGFASSMITFATSAFWHGIAVGYYLSFVLGGFIQFAQRLARQYFRPFFLGAEGAPPSLAKRAYDVAGILVSVAILNYAVIPFQLLDFKKSILGWHRVGWYGHILVGAPIVFFQNGGKKIVRSLAEKRGVAIASSKKAPGKVAIPPSDTSASTPATPGALGAPNGANPQVPPVEEGVKEAGKVFESVQEGLEHTLEDKKTK